MRVKIESWFQEDCRDHYSISLTLQGESQRLSVGDLAILRANASDDRVAILYGIVVRASATANARHGSRQGSANSGRTFQVNIQISRISTETKRHQQQTLDAAKEFVVQFVTVQPTDKKGSSFQERRFLSCHGNNAHYMGFKAKLQIQDSLRIGPSQEVSAKNLSG